MKYLKLFEAFDSEKLSATLSYINKKSREEVLSKIKSHCNQIGFPYSKLDDSVFQYLPFQRALNFKSKAADREKCKSESYQLYANGIKGEFCKEGRIKRNWGNGTRIVECPNCQGTGLEPLKLNKTVTHFKFWFSKEGEYITTTGLDMSTSSDDPYSFNKYVSQGWSGYSLITKKYETEKNLAGAHFALIFDLEHLKKSDYQNLTDIRSDRMKLKSDSNLTNSDESVRKANIERYMSKIAERTDIIKDISKLTKVVMRTIDYKNILYYMLCNSNRYIYSPLSTLSRLYIDALEGGVDEQKELSNWIRSKYTQKAEESNRIQDNLKSIRLKCENPVDQTIDSASSEKLELIERIDKLNENIYNKIIGIKLDCVEDIDILSAKLNSLKGIFIGDRYNLEFLNFFFDSVVTEDNKSSYFYFAHYRINSNIKSIFIGLERANKVVERF